MISSLREISWCAWRLCGAAMVAVMLFSGTEAAGQGTSGSIIGQVTDESGAILPGVTVTLRSPALQLPQMTAVTDERGEYRFTPLPIGVYAIDYELSGFQTLRQEGVRLTIGFVAKLDQTMKVGALEETLTVSGAAPVVDVVSSGTRTELTRENVDLIPTTRDGVTSYLGQVPGVRAKFDVGGAEFAETTETRGIGIAGHEWMLLEGIFAHRLSPGSGAQTAHYDFNSIEGTRIQLVGNSAEMPRPGIMIEMTTKSGGNAFSGEVNWAGTHENLQGNNIDDRLRAQGIRGRDRITGRHDVGGIFGGKIIQDKLWFHLAARTRNTKSENLGGAHLGVRNQGQKYLTQKYSYQMRPQDRLIGFVVSSWGDDFNRGASQFVPLESTDDNVSYYTTAKVEWQGTRGQSTAISLQGGWWIGRSNYGGHAPGKPLTTDIRTLMVSGDHRNANRWHEQANYHNRGWLTQYAPELLNGNHEFKVGFDHLITKWNPGWGARRSGDYELRFDNGVPIEINTFNDPLIQQNTTNYVGVYAQDRWTLARRLTLNLGIRYAHDNAYLPAQCREAGTFGRAECYDKVQLKVWNSLVPRFHAAYDLFGTGRAVLKGGWGRFAAIRESAGNEVVQLNPNAAETVRYRWRDLNGNRDYDPGEVNLALDGPDFISFSTPSRGVVNPDDKPRTIDELSVGYDQELMQNFALQLAGIYSRQVDGQRVLNVAIPYEAYNIPVTNIDPGPDGVAGNSDDGGLVTYWEYPEAFRPGSIQQFRFFNDPNARQTFKTFQITGLKRMSSNWQMVASYSATLKDVPFADELAFNPNAEINTGDNTWEWTAKLAGSYLLPYGIIPSFNFQHRSGDPLARQVQFRGGRTIPNLVVNVEPLGSLRTPNINLLDVRVAKRFSLRGTRQLDVQLDIYNVMNSNTVRTLTVRSGSNFGVPTLIMLPRIAQFGVAFRF